MFTLQYKHLPNDAVEDGRGPGDTQLILAQCHRLGLLDLRFIGRRLLLRFGFGDRNTDVLVEESKGWGGAGGVHTFKARVFVSWLGDTFI